MASLWCRNRKWIMQHHTRVWSDAYVSSCPGPTFGVACCVGFFLWRRVHGACPRGRGLLAALRLAFSFARVEGEARSQHISSKGQGTPSEAHANLARCPLRMPMPLSLLRRHEMLPLLLRATRARLPLSDSHNRTDQVLSRSGVPKTEENGTRGGAERGSRGRSIGDVCQREHRKASLTSSLADTFKKSIFFTSVCILHPSVLAATSAALPLSAWPLLSNTRHARGGIMLRADTPRVNKNKGSNGQ